MAKKLTIFSVFFLFGVFGQVKKSNTTFFSSNVSKNKPNKAVMRIDWSTLNVTSSPISRMHADTKSEISLNRKIRLD